MVINKAFLHPAVRQRMDLMVRVGRQLGLAPEIRSTVRDSGTQIDLWERCRRREASFPVKQPGCSQHEWGMAFDMKATQGTQVMGRPLPGRIVSLACALLGLCPSPLDPAPLPPAQFSLQLLGRRLGLSSPQSDPIHFSVFPSSVWDPHMKSEFGLGCATCTPRAGQSLSGSLGLREFTVPGLGRERPQTISSF